jgi:hypothetical protein
MQVSAESVAGSCFHVGAVISVGADDTLGFVRPECGDSLRQSRNPVPR